MTHETDMLIGLDIAVAAGMLYAGAWSPSASVVVLAGVALAGAALQLLILRRGT